MRDGEADTAAEAVAKIELSDLTRYDHLCGIETASANAVLASVPQTFFNALAAYVAQKRSDPEAQHYEKLEVAQQLSD